MPMKVLSLFSGIGAFEKALTNMGVKYELVNFCEIDRYASKSYSAIHSVPESKNLGDITKVDTSKLPDDIDILTYGFPCQDISLAGRQRGFEYEGERTRSGLFFEALRLIEDLQPKVAICENVKNLTSNKFSKEFQIVLESLEEGGYKNYWKVLNAKDYGIPQNRERVFIISIREDIDRGYDFPEPYPLELRLKDMLDEVVDEKYYLSEKMIAGFSKHNEKHEEKGTGFIWKPKNGDDVANCLRANAALCPTDNTVEIVNGKPKLLQVAQMYPNSGNPQAGRIYSDDGISPAMDTCSGGNRMPKIVVRDDKPGNTNPSGKSQCNDVYDESGLHPTLCAGTHGNCNSSILVREATKQGYAEAHEGDSINLEQPNSKTRRGRVGVGVAQTLTTCPQQCVVEPVAAAMRGRYNESGETEQQVELSDRDYANTITTVQKDSMVCEPVCLNSKGGRGGVDGLQPSLQDCVYDSEAISTAVTTSYMPNFTHGLRIRKLTPKECYRLMGFDDKDYTAAAKVCSQSQLYKQAGNSIVVDVIEEIYEKLFNLYWEDIR